MMPHARTKIVATIGPASSKPEVLAALIAQGVDVARINFSHGTHEQHARTITTIRGLALDAGKPVAILGDLQGPRIRIGHLPVPLEIVDGQSLVFVHESAATCDEVPV